MKKVAVSRESPEANPRLAKYIITQYGGRWGIGRILALPEPALPYAHRNSGHFKRYRNGRTGSPEIVGTLVYKLTKDASIEEIKESDFGAYYADHDRPSTLLVPPVCLYCGLPSIQG